MGYDLPPRLPRPDPHTDEGGLWAMLDREEERLKRSPFRVREAGLNDYVHGVACRLGQVHCPDLRTYVMRSPYFNANMAANGMMQVWTGLLLRTSNEAQLAAVVGHEIGHYLSRHSLAGLRDAKARSAWATMLMTIPIAGPLAALGTLAGGFAYTRDQERAADSIGMDLMAAAGYPPMQASMVWSNLIEELAAEKDWSGDAGKRSYLFATHPMEQERQAAMAAKARTLGLADRDPAAGALRQAIAPYRGPWLEDELKRRRFGESRALLTRLRADDPADGETAFFLGELYRKRNEAGDPERALATLEEAAALPGAPPEVYRSMGMVHQKAGRIPEMKSAFARYLEAKPGAEDAEMIRSYLEQGS
jgi:predicted Zn-dependent protease